MSQQSSINFDNESSLFLEPPRANGNQASNFAGKSKFVNEGVQKMKNGMQRICVDVVGEDRSNRMKVSSSFENLMQNLPKTKITTVSFMGPKRIGKSFLLDCVLSYQSPPLGRSMCKSSFYPITTSFPPLPVDEHNHIVYFDCGGQISPQIFLTTYIVSSVLVYNMSPNSQSEQLTLLEYLGYVHNRLQMEIGSVETLKPKLVIVKRDATGNERTQNQSQFFHKIQQLKLLKSINIFRLVFTLLFSHTQLLPTLHPNKYAIFLHISFHKTFSHKLSPFLISFCQVLLKVFDTHQQIEHCLHFCNIYWEEQRKMEVQIWGKCKQNDIEMEESI